jgi:methylated-DNA-[protein]-cysteine S-methyltransferase
MTARNYDTVLFNTGALGWIELASAEKGLTHIKYLSGKGIGPYKTNNPVLEQSIEELEEYFNGRRKVFDIPVDLSAGRPFQQSVWKALISIPWGETRSYGDVAQMIGNPRAARAVGSANRSNPIPIVVPCHRVIRADNQLGGYNSGVERKRALLELEGMFSD